MKKNYIMFMDGVEWQHHMEDDINGVKLYPSLKDLRSDSPCIDECGVVTVKVTLSKWVMKQKITKEVKR